MTLNESTAYQKKLIKQNIKSYIYTKQHWPKFWCRPYIPVTMCHYSIFLKLTCQASSYTCKNSVWSTSN